MAITTSPANGREIAAALAAQPCPCDADPTAVASSDKSFSCRDFRRALGRFPTGVTVVTALAPDGRPIGLTVSSFNSVSLDPPLILWSLSLASPNFEALRSADHYAINVLSADQQTISDRFASRANDRFADLALAAGLSGAPLIAGCCAWFECVNEAHYPGGDHMIFVGRVERFAYGEAELPLVFHNGRYRWLEAEAGE